jgi:hypothetical protein
MNNSLTDTETTVLATVASVAAMGAMVPFDFIAIAREKAQLGMELENYAPKVGLITSSLHSGVVAFLELAINTALPPATLLAALGEAAELSAVVADVAVSLPAMALTAPFKNAVYLTDRAGEHCDLDGGVRLGATPASALTTQCGAPGAVSASAVLSLWHSLGFTVAGCLVYRAALGALNASELFGDGDEAAEESDDVVSVSKLQLALKTWLVATSAALFAYPLDTLRRRTIIVAYRGASERKARRLRSKTTTLTGVLERDDAPVVVTPLAASTISTARLFAGAEKLVLHSAISAVVAGGLLALATKVYVAARNVARSRATKEN